MGVPYNFLQELSGVRKTIAPYEFNNSVRYIGTASQLNYFYGSESGDTYATLNLQQKRNASNEKTFTYSYLENLSNQRAITESGYIGLSFSRTALKYNPLETGSISLAISGRQVRYPQETGLISLSLSPSFQSGFNELSHVNVSFNYNLTECLREETTGELNLEVFIKKINQEHFSLGLVLSTGAYEGVTFVFVDKNDKSNLGLIILTGTYQGF